MGIATNNAFIHSKALNMMILLLVSCKEMLFVMKCGKQCLTSGKRTKNLWFDFGQILDWWEMCSPGRLNKHPDREHNRWWRWWQGRWVWGCWCEVQSSRHGHYPSHGRSQVSSGLLRDIQPTVAPTQVQLCDVQSSRHRHYPSHLYPRWVQGSGVWFSELKTFSYP